MRDVTTSDAPGGSGPFSQAIIDGSTIYTAGQGGVDPDTGEIVDGGIEAETRQTLENIETILEAAGVSLDDVVKINIYLTDMDDYEEMNATYDEFFEEPFPVRSAVEVSDLPIDICIEIEAVAQLPE
jgi:2-iminobutanoate/2-iminopropanoate deaminase